MNDTIDITTQIDVLHDGLAFGEGPRFHDEKLYFSDMHAREVLSFSPSSGPSSRKVQVEVRLDDDEPSGLGWLPNGDLLIVGMGSKSLLRLPADASDAPAAPDKAAIEIYVDLSDLAPGRCNDMVVLPDGGAYVGNFGFDLHAGEKLRPTDLIYVSPDGKAMHCAKDLVFPNGTVVTADKKTLIVAETFASRLTRYDIKSDGSLDNRAVWAELPEGAVPDGICLDEAAGIWVASPTSNECLRIEQGGNVSHRVPLDRGAFACMLGGKDLYILAAFSSEPEKCKQQRAGQLLRVSAPYAGAGYP